MATTEEQKVADAKPAASDDEEIVVAPKKTTKKEEKSPEELHKERLQKTKAAADIVHKTFDALVKASVEGASIIKLCVEGDEQIAKLAAGVYTQKVDGNTISKGMCYSMPRDVICCDRPDRP
jgi:hypothetical protein